MPRMAKDRGDKSRGRLQNALMGDVGGGGSGLSHGLDGPPAGEFDLAFVDALQDILRDERRARLWLSMPQSCPSPR